ncbi:hypothetical protein [Salinibacter ruber]|uniref:Uncharacterized protein n=1 Tax=Salinibacter ruber TaxID=146919 RepID=A0AAW5P701_9BACT|nr:hypothetical protein [Salinibacter ruber]MCS4157611.1 hypothetical protein [Salinibacter ruber]
MIVTSRPDPNLDVDESGTYADLTLSARPQDVKKDARELGAETAKQSRQEQQKSWNNLKEQIRDFFLQDTLEEIEREFWIGVGIGQR